MKKQLIIALFAVAATAITANAQEGRPTTAPAPASSGKPAPDKKQGPQKPDAEKRAQQHTAQIDKWCTLTPEQKPKVMDINKQIAAKMIAAESQKGEAKKGLGKQKQIIEGERTQLLAGVLTPAQMDLYKKAKEEKKEMKEENKGKKGKPEEPAKSTEPVKATEGK